MWNSLFFNSAVWNMDVLPESNDRPLSLRQHNLSKCELSPKYRPKRKCLHEDFDSNFTKPSPPAASIKRRRLQDVEADVVLGSSNSFTNSSGSAESPERMTCLLEKNPVQKIVPKELHISPETTYNFLPLSQHKHVRRCLLDDFASKNGFASQDSHHTQCSDVMKKPRYQNPLFHHKPARRCLLKDLAPQDDFAPDNIHRSECSAVVKKPCHEDNMVPHELVQRNDSGDETPDCQRQNFKIQELLFQRKRVRRCVLKDFVAQDDFAPENSHRSESSAVMKKHCHQDPLFQHKKVRRSLLDDLASEDDLVSEDDLKSGDDLVSEDDLVSGDDLVPEDFFVSEDDLVPEHDFVPEHDLFQRKRVCRCLLKYFVAEDDFAPDNSSCSECSAVMKEPCHQYNIAPHEVVEKKDSADVIPDCQYPSLDIQITLMMQRLKLSEDSIP